MARIRTIKPEFFTSETIQKLPFGARLTFIGVWTSADDEGRAHDNAKLMKASVWPLDARVSPQRVDRWLQDLADLGLVQRYCVEGKRFLQVNAWLEHQKINRPTPSKFPPPPESSVNDHGVLSESSRGERKGTGNREQGKELAPTARTALKDSLVTLSGWRPEHMSESMWGRVERAAKEAAALGAEPSDLSVAAELAQEKYPGVDVTPQAIVGWLASVEKWQSEPTRRRK